MEFTSVLHSEWLEIRTLRSLVAGLCAVLPATALFSVLAATDSDGAEFDPLFSVFFGVDFGQIAAVAFGTTAVAAEFRGGALHATLVAVPWRGGGSRRRRSPSPCLSWERGWSQAE